MIVAAEVLLEKERLGFSRQDPGIFQSTFQESGKVGLWTKADSVTYFDDFFVAPLNR